MPRGRQYYDPIQQAPSRVETQGERRIELYPKGDIRDGEVRPKWMARLIAPDGLIEQHSPGSFDHDDAMRQAQEMWPGLEVFELREEWEDSTHEGMGPSPRLWQNTSPQMGFPGERIPKDTPPVDRDAEILRLADAVQDSPDASRQIRAIVASDPGSYVHIADIILVLEDYAAQYDGMNNPSGAVALREAAGALREAF